MQKIPSHQHWMITTAYILLLVNSIKPSAIFDTDYANLSPNRSRSSSLQSNRQNSSSINADLQTLVTGLASLSSRCRPANIDLALSLIIKGAQVFQEVDAFRFFNACCMTNLSSHEHQIFHNALNTHDNDFWKIIEKNTTLQKSIEKCNVTFDKENFISLDYNMLFRMSYIRLYISNEKTLLNFKYAYQQALIALQWFLFAQAIIQDDIFTSGMITMPDLSSTIFLFIDGYAELISPCYKFYSGLHPHSLWQTEGYTRKSNHWSGYKRFNDHNFGIDFKDQQGNFLHDLPCNKSHLLFGMLKNGFCFIKWEEYGVTINFSDGDFSAIPHVMRYFQKKDREDKTEERREKIPHDVMLQFKALYTKKLTHKEAADIQAYGIKTMLKLLSSDPSALKIFKTFLKTRKDFDMETVNQRKGNEIILKPNNFVYFT